MFSLGSHVMIRICLFLTLFTTRTTKGYAIPAINCVSSSGINACLEAARKNDAPVIIQFSSGGSQVSWLGEFAPCQGSLNSSDLQRAAIVLRRKGIEQQQL